MVPSNGHMHQKEWHTQKDDRLPASQHPGSHKGRRKPSSTHGMVTTVYPSIPKTDTIPLVSLLGAATDTAQPVKATLPQVTDTPGDTTRSPHPSQTKPNA